MGNENVIEPCRAIRYRYHVNFVTVRPTRHGSLANRNRLRHPASQRRGRIAEAGGEATEAAGGGTATTEADARCKHNCISPDIAEHSNATACARFDDGEACRA